MCEDHANDHETDKSPNLKSIDYCVLDPTGNITILVTSSVPVHLQPQIASQLMNLEPEAEQVGFLSRDDSCDIALRMAGGEFCGNASMCAAVYAASEAGTVSSDVILRVSGSSDPVRAKVKMHDNGYWTGTVHMPEPAKIERISLAGAGYVPVVSFDGISHVILEEGMCRSQAENFARAWCSALQSEAIGLMFLDRAKASLTPLVYVPAADTLFWENSCASGTTAVGAFLASECGKPYTAAFEQPGGKLTVEVTADGELCLTGTVRIRCVRNTVLL